MSEVRLRINENIELKALMSIDFDNIEYLRLGNEKQRLAYKTLTRNNVLTILQLFDPILAGTIPLSIDIENSDLDIICCCKDSFVFMKTITDNFGSKEHFKIWEQTGGEHNAIVANFYLDTFEVEIFGQNIPTKQQNAYRHMMIEHKLLVERGEVFRQQIIDLKRKGYKTEPAFGIALGLKGDAYLELLTYENMREDETDSPNRYSR